MRTMRDKMIQLEKNTIDIGRNPYQAIEVISNPLLDQLQEQVNSQHQPSLEENMTEKSKLDKQETSLNSQIYDQQIQQVRIRENLIDQRALLEDMANDIESIKEQVEAKRQRKQVLQDKVSAMTQEMVSQVVNISKQLGETQDAVLYWKQKKDEFVKQQEQLERERTNGNYRYAHSIEDIIERAQALEKANQELLEVLE